MREEAVSRQPSAVSVLLSVTVLLLALPCPARTQQIPYGVGRWEPDSTGNHRAVVRVGAAAAPQPGAPAPKAEAARAIWTPRAIKLAQEAGLDPAKINDIEATGPGGRVSGDDFTQDLARKKNA